MPYIAGVDTGTELAHIATEHSAQGYAAHALPLDEAAGLLCTCDLVVIELPGEGYIPPARHAGVLAARDLAIRLHDRLVCRGVSAHLIRRVMILEHILGIRTEAHADDKLSHHYIEHYPGEMKGALKNKNRRDAFAALLFATHLREMEERE